MIYSLISAGNEKILCEANVQTGNYPQIVQKVLREKNPSNTRTIYQMNNFMAHILNDGQVTFLVLTDTGFSRKAAFGYLLDIKQEFYVRYTQRQIADSFAYSLNQFADYMKNRMEYFSDDSQDGLKKVVNQLEDTKNIMVDNIEKMLERGEKIEILVKKTQDMKGESSNMRNRSEQLKNKKRCENIRNKLILILIALLIVYAIIAIFCGFDLHCLRSS